MLTLFSEVWIQRKGENESQVSDLCANSSNAIYTYWIKGSAHFDFSDLPAFSPLAHAFGLKGSINGQRVLRIINDYTLDFFNHYLLGEELKILDQPQGLYPEVIQLLYFSQIKMGM